MPQNPVPTAPRRAHVFTRGRTAVDVLWVESLRAGRSLTKLVVRVRHVVVQVFGVEWKGRREGGGSYPPV